MTARLILDGLNILRTFFLINGFMEFVSLMTLNLLINRRNPLLLKNNNAK